MRNTFLLILFLYANGFQARSQSTTVFEKGEAGYQCFRIPAIVKAPDGTLLAFAEGRVNNCGDFGNVDIVMKISEDQGKTWGSLTVVANNDTLQAGNPAPVYDLTDPRYPQGRLFMIYNTGYASEHHNREGKGVREVYYITSTDEGKTWSEPVNITTSVHKPNQPDYNAGYKFGEDWRSYANTPGHAIQLMGKKHRGRLLVPANHSSGPPQEKFLDYRAHAFYSDDHGATWHLSSVVDYPGSNESTAAELPDGRVLMNMRDQSGINKYRLVTVSRSGGKKWGPVRVENQLPDPVCEGSLLAIQGRGGQPALVFSNLNHQSKRQNLTLYKSNDEGATWQPVRVVEPGSAAYSDLVQQSDGAIGVLFERDNYRQINYTPVRVDLD